MAISQQDYERLFGSNKNTSKTKDLDNKKSNNILTNDI